MNTKPISEVDLMSSDPIAHRLREMAKDLIRLDDASSDVEREDYTADYAACLAGARAWECLAALVTKLDEVHADPQFKGVWAMLAIRGGTYTGPQYKDELDAARSLVTDPVREPER